MFSLRRIRLVFSIFSAVFRTGGTSEQCRDSSSNTFAYFSVITDHALFGHVTARVSSISQLDCSQKCFLDFTCRSYNYGHIHNVENTCELNDAFKDEYQEHFVTSKNSTYYERVAFRSWFKLNKEEVCYGAKDRGDYGRISVPLAGSITAFRLQYLHGYVSCNTGHGSKTRSKWGCGEHPDAAKYGLHSLNVLVTNSSNQIIAPHNPTYLVPHLAWYSLPGFTSRSFEVVLTATPGLKVGQNQELRVWYGEVLYGGYTSNNGGRACMNAFAFFTKEP